MGAVKKQSVEPPQQQRPDLLEAIFVLAEDSDEGIGRVLRLSNGTIPVYEDAGEALTVCDVMKKASSKNYAVHRYNAALVGKVIPL